MNISNEEMAPSFPFGCWDLSVMVEMVRCKQREVEAVEKNQNPNERPFGYRTPRATSSTLLTPIHC